MLSDTKIDRFIEDFPRQWLQLHRLGMFPPDGKLYPDYDVWLEASMHKEVVNFFRRGVCQQPAPRSIHFFGLDHGQSPGSVNSTVCPNQRYLGRFSAFPLKPETQRGGLLTMGAVLGLTSDGTRHRPVHRGVWISEAISRKNSATTSGQRRPDRTESPRQSQGDDPTKNRGPHRPTPIAPPVIRRSIRWDSPLISLTRLVNGGPTSASRKGTGDDPPVDASGEMPDGRAFADAAQFKELLLDDRDRFLKAFVEHLCTYSLRRVLTVDDRDDIRRLSTKRSRRTTN